MSVMNEKALEKIAQGELMMPLATGGSLALLAHALTKKNDDEEKDESSLGKAVRVLAPISAGIGGAYLGSKLNESLKTPEDSGLDLLKKEIQLDDAQENKLIADIVAKGGKFSGAAGLGVGGTNVLRGLLAEKGLVGKGAKLKGLLPAVVTSSDVAQGALSGAAKYRAVGKASLKNGIPALAGLAALGVGSVASRYSNKKKIELAQLVKEIERLKSK